MQHSKTQDTLVGFFVACGIAALFYMALQISNLGTYTSNESYTVSARFQNSGGLKVKSPVSVAGVRIGRVAAIRRVYLRRHNILREHKRFASRSHPERAD